MGAILHFERAARKRRTRIDCRRGSPRKKPDYPNGVELVMSVRRRVAQPKLWQLPIDLAGVLGDIKDTEILSHLIDALPAAHRFHVKNAL